MRLFILRHGPTDWNESGRYTGSTDIPLSENGRRELLRWRLPQEALVAELWSSPLLRARETALAFGEPKCDARLREMSFGSWEGRTHAEVESELPEADLVQDWNGLDYKPHGGESLREVQERVKEWLRERALSQKDLLVVSHKMTITALYALAAGWDASHKPVQRLQFPALHVFQIDSAGHPRVERLNQALF